MSAEPSHVPQIRDVFKVSQWKWNIDKGSPRWKHLFFNWIFLPFLNFSFHLGIPTPKEVIVESDEHGNVRRTFRWFEDEGIFEHEDQADAGCLDEHWGYCRLPYGQLMPPGSGSYSTAVFPRKKNPRKWARRTFPFIIKDRKQDEQKEETLARTLEHLNQVLDRR